MLVIAGSIIESFAKFGMQLLYKPFRCFSSTPEYHEMKLGTILHRQIRENHHGIWKSVLLGNCRAVWWCHLSNGQMGFRKGQTMSRKDECRLIQVIQLSIKFSGMLHLGLSIPQWSRKKKCASIKSRPGPADQRTGTVRAEATKAGV